MEAINSAPKEKRPAVLVSSTAVGFYGKSPVALSRPKKGK